jgi:radical SAM superfamily enzyme YgiQ (UPF0313 family)
MSRANGISEEMVKLAAEAGCTEIAIGIESVWPETLKLINKGINLEKAKAYIKTLKKYEIGTKLLFILGLPGESDDIVSHTLDFIDETEPTGVQLALLCPLPGSEIGDNPEKFGIKNINPNWDEYRMLYGRFDEGEKPQLMFEYEDVTPWGKSKSTEKIVSDYIELQAILREKGLNF